MDEHIPRYTHTSVVHHFWAFASSFLPSLLVQCETCHSSIQQDLMLEEKALKRRQRAHVSFACCKVTSETTQRHYTHTFEMQNPYSSAMNRTNKSAAVTCLWSVVQHTLTLSTTPIHSLSTGANEDQCQKFSKEQLSPEAPDTEPSTTFRTYQKLEKRTVEITESNLYWDNIYMKWKQQTVKIKLDIRQSSTMYSHNAYCYLLQQGGNRTTCSKGWRKHR